MRDDGISHVNYNVSKENKVEPLVYKHFNASKSQDINFPHLG